MAAYVFVAINTHDPLWKDNYFQNVPALVQKHGGSLVAASQTIKRYEGTGGDPDQVVILTFPSLPSIEEFMTDPEYRPYLEARLAGSSCDLLAFDAEPDSIVSATKVCFKAMSQTPATGRRPAVDKEGAEAPWIT